MTQDQDNFEPEPRAFGQGCWHGCGWGLGLLAVAWAVTLVLSRLRVLTTDFIGLGARSARLLAGVFVGLSFLFVLKVASLLIHADGEAEQGYRKGLLIAAILAVGFLFLNPLSLCLLGRACD